MINLASIYSGHSIGGFDLDKIQGDRLVLGIGKAGEPYEGIGRGELNIEGMPVYRDAVGGVGTGCMESELFGNAFHYYLQNDRSHPPKVL